MDAFNLNVCERFCLIWQAIGFAAATTRRWMCDRGIAEPTARLALYRLYKRDTREDGARFAHWFWPALSDAQARRFVELMYETAPVIERARREPFA